MAKAAPPGQLKASSARSSTTLAIILTRPPPTSAGVGKALADHVRQRFPAVKVLYQTGFSDMLFENRAELEEGAAFLEKPFTARGLREAARLMLFGSINP